MLPSLRKLRLRAFHDPVALVSAIPISIVVLAGMILSLRSHSLLRQDRDLVVHTYRVIETTDQVLLAIGDAETGQRGFIITGDLAFLVPYQRASHTTIPDKVGALQELVGDNGPQRQRIADLKKLLEQKFQELAATIQTFHNGGFTAARSVISHRTGKNLMDEIRRVTRDIKSTEQLLLEKRNQEVQRDERRIVMVAIGTALCSTLLRIGIAVVRQRLLRDPGNDAAANQT